MRAMEAQDDGAPAGATTTTTTTTPLPATTTTTSGSSDVVECDDEAMLGCSSQQLPIHVVLGDGGSDLAGFMACEPCHSQYGAQLRSEATICQARSSAVHWMIKVRNVYGFSPLTAALSVGFFDRYLSKELRRRVWKAWMIELLSVSCISLAAKMEEPVVPLLQDLQVEGLDHLFESKTIQRMEIAVLKMLDWRLNLVTPFSYIEGLLYGIDISTQLRNLLISRISELLVGTLPEAEFLAYSPSVVAVAATMCALEEAVPLQADAHKRTLAKILPLEEGNLNGCYKLMEELVADPLYPMVSSSRVLVETRSADAQHVGAAEKSPADVAAEAEKFSGRCGKRRVGSSSSSRSTSAAAASTTTTITTTASTTTNTAAATSSAPPMSTTTSSSTRSTKRKLQEFLCKEDL